MSILSNSRPTLQGHDRSFLKITLHTVQHLLDIVQSCTPPNLALQRFHQLLHICQRCTSGALKLFHHLLGVNKRCSALILALPILYDTLDVVQNGARLMLFQPICDCCISAFLIRINIQVSLEEVDGLVLNLAILAHTCSTACLLLRLCFCTECCA